jgi:hypothetical protein
MNKFILLLLVFFIAGCNANESFIDPLKPEFETISFDVVQKQLSIEQELPEHIQNLLSQWFDQRVKIDGFDGDMRFVISDFKQEISSIDDGKRVDISLSFEVTLNKPSQSQTKFIEGNISSYGTLTGNFSLNEFDTVIQNTQSDLILRLSRDLKSKI